MRKVLYAKYNRTRKPQFQISTCIYETAGERYVEKKALTSEAVEHIRAFDDRYKKLVGCFGENLYCRPRVSDDTVTFQYIDGENLSSWLESDIRDIKKLLPKIEKILPEIFPEKECVPFETGKEFEEMFGKVSADTGSWKSYSVTNLDATFENYIKKDGKWNCIDYEWVFDFPIPAEYIKYRSLLYFYGKNYQYLSIQIKQEDFMNHFGFDSEISDLYMQLEEHFQQYVHGENREWIYTTRYQKQMKNFRHMVQIADESNSWREHFEDSKQQYQVLDDSFKELTRQKNEVSEKLECSELLVEAQRQEMLENKQKMYEQKKKISEQEREIDCQKQQIAELTEKTNKFRRMIKNPAYLAAYVVKKGTHSLADKVTPKSVKKTYGILKREGFDALKYRRKYFDASWDMYQDWIRLSEETAVGKKVEEFSYNPLVSIVVPVYNVASDQLKECIESVQNQIYTNWELCLVDDASTMKSVAEVMHQYESDDKIKMKFRESNGHISRTTNDGFAMATGEFVALLDCDDVLTPDALYEMVKMLNDNREYDFIYSDEDKIDETGKIRNNPFFKPDWSPDTFMSLMYTCHFSMFRKSLIDKLGGMRIGFEGSQDYDLVLRVMENTQHIGHVPKILYHWRTRKESTANDMAAKPYILESTVRAKEDAIRRRGHTGHLEFIEEVCQYRVVYDVKDNPKVSIIIPSKDNYSILEQCITSIYDMSTYDNYEVVVVDNGSSQENKQKYTHLCGKYGVKYIYYPEDFNFSHMCNTGAQNSDGEYLLFLNDDIEIIQKDWIERMLGQAQLEHTGAVGCKLIYPDTNKIQHTGVVNYAVGPGHCFNGFDDSLNCYFGRNILDYNYTIVTAACIMVNREKFNSVNGFEERLPVAYNDVELCFKLVEKGLYNVVRNDVKLIHYESISRGYDEAPEKAARLKREAAFLYELHPDFVGYDPCYNPNLVQDRDDFAFNVKNMRDIPSPIQHDFAVENYPEAANNIRYSVDECSQNKEYIHISGWIYDENVHNNRKEAVNIILKNKENGKSFVYEVARTFRPDVSRTYGRKGNKAFSGYDTHISKKDLDSGVYEVYELYRGYKITTNKNLSV